MDLNGGTALGLQPTLVTKGGERVTFYEVNARGKHMIHGAIHYTCFDTIMSWDYLGKSNSSTDSMDLIPWSANEHFPWEGLPSWASLCIFRDKHGMWFCGSVRPTWHVEERRYTVKERGVYIPLPPAVVETLLYTGSDFESLFINPSMEEED